MRSSPRRVGIVMPLATQQGGAEALLQQVLQFRSDRLEIVCVFLQDGPLVDEARALGYRTQVIPATHLRDAGNYLKTVLALRRWIKAEELDLVFSWMLKAHLYVANAAVLLPLRTMWFQHGIPEKGWMNRVGTLLPADAVLCCSEHSRAAQDLLFPRRPSFVCYPGVRLTAGGQLTQQQARERLGLPADAHIIGMVARWERWKGAHIFVEAAKQVAARDPHAVCFVLGGPHPFDLPYAEELRRLAADAGLGDRLILAGQRPSDEVPLWHASADLIVHPATSAEPFGMAVVEAMGKGKVVIATNLGGPSEIIEDGINGVLIPPAQPALLAETILQLLSQGELRERLAANAYTRARTFSIERCVQRFEQLLCHAAEPVSSDPLASANRSGIKL